ncbi:hypothetical protein D7030_05720 [Flavobacteriaceae bacterium AU392]|nr:hypothetical protein D1817_02700 [Flavobacteriaceae bacterium]RKM84632.1 hypothetical protein D7030_05720 [Flavobacteriaceae bacterium AU392]
MNKILLLFLLILVYSCSSDDPDPDIIAPTNVVFTLNSLSTDTTQPLMISTTLEINVSADDEIGVAKVEIFIDGVEVAEDVSAPFNLTVDVSSLETGNHTLRVSVSDAAGNTTSVEEIIFVDNTMPSITNVSIENDQIIGGNDNLLTFDVSDDNGIENVVVSINGDNISEITDEVYEVNIETLDLQDGTNEIQITATDLTGNVSNLTLNFIADNSGPEITINSISENQIIDDIINFNPSVDDAFSEVASLEVLLNDERIQFFEDINDFSFEFDPELVATGNNVFTFIAIDALGNLNEIVISTEILRILIRVNLPQDFVPSAVIESWIFASNPDGTPIVAEQISDATTDVVLHAPAEFNMTDEFMVTFYEVDNGNFNRISTLQNFTRVLPGTINIRERNQFPSFTGTDYNVSGFESVGSDVINAEGVDYSGSRQTDEIFHLELKQPQLTNNIYFYSFSNPFNVNSYSYQLVNRPIATDFSIEDANFSTVDVTVENFIINDDGNFNFPINTFIDPALTILGFENQADLENNVFHELFRFNIGANQIGTPILYPLNNSFAFYRHQVSFDNFLTERLGSPLSDYTRPDWSIDPTLTNNNSIILTTSGSSHTVGRAFLRNNASIPGNNYTWTLVYDSQSNNTEVIIPQLPDELSSLAFFNFLESESLEIEQIDLSGYESIQSYDDYIDRVLRDNLDYFEVSDFVETISYRSLGRQFLLSDLIF